MSASKQRKKPAAKFQFHKLQNEFWRQNSMTSNCSQDCRFAVALSIARCKKPEDDRRAEDMALALGISQWRCRQMQQKMLLLANKRTETELKVEEKSEQDIPARFDSIRGDWARGGPFQSCVME